MTIGQTASKTKAVLLAAAVLAVPTAVRAAPADTYYERAFVVAADARCNLFAPNIEAALDALDASTMYRSVFGDGFVEYYLMMKRAEAARYAASVDGLDDAGDVAAAQARWQMSEYFEFY